MRKLLAFAMLATAAYSAADTFSMTGGGITITDNATNSSSGSFAGLAGTITHLDSVEVSVSPILGSAT